MKKETKRRWHSALEHYPLLRVMLWDTRFRWFAAGALATVLAIGIMLPKMWRVSPKDLPQVIRISGIDYLQAWALRRSAMKEQAAGQWSKALMAWEMARANNPGDPELSRGVIRTKMGQNNRVTDRAATADGSWLLRLTRTNAADLALVAKWYASCQMDKETADLLEAQPAPLVPALESAYLKALFNQGSLSKFSQRWDKFQTNAPTDPELNLYRTAFLATRDSSDSAHEARIALDKLAAAPGELHITANRLELLVAVLLKDSDRAALAVRHLEQAGANTLQHHLLYWRILADSPESNKVPPLMDAYSEKPSKISETKAWLELWLKFGNDDQAERLLKWSTENQPLDVGLCVRHASLLIGQKRWEDLSALGLNLRMRTGSSAPVLAFGHYLEARGAFGADRVFNIQRFVDAILGLNADVAGFALVMGNGLTEMGFASAALSVLKQSEGHWSKVPDYWLAMCVAADRARDENTLSYAAKRAYELDPKNSVMANNQASALLIGRRQPGEAVALTSQLRRERPGNVLIAINHASALLVNQRAEEAREILTAIQPDRLTRAEAAQYQFACFELWWQLGKATLAWEAYDKLERSTLFPEQERWLKATMEKLGKRP